MDYTAIGDQLYRSVDNLAVEKFLQNLSSKHADHCNREVYEFCLGCLDLTSLGATDSPSHIHEFALKAADFNRHFPHLPHVATICVYPVFVDVAGLALNESEVGITSVGGGFPVSKTFLEVKMLECAMAEENGADEIDIVINLGHYLDGNYELVANEIETICHELNVDTVLKVIIESGMLSSLDDVRRASVLAMAAGADMIKTSTGINGPGASPEAVTVMCEGIKDYYEYSGKRVGMKVAGGVRTAEDAVLYYTIVKEILGEEWLTPELFRIGASALANNLLSAIEGHEVTYF